MKNGSENSRQNKTTISVYAEEGKNTNTIFRVILITKREISNSSQRKSIDSISERTTAFKYPISSRFLAGRLLLCAVTTFPTPIYTASVLIHGVLSTTPTPCCRKP